jgi:cytochrome P450
LLLWCRYIVYIKDAEVQHKIFSNVHSEGFELIGHPFGKKIFGENNMIMMRGEQHKDLRRRLLPLFSVKALGAYVEIQVSRPGGTWGGHPDRSGHQGRMRARPQPCALTAMVHATWRGKEPFIPDSR